MITGDKRTQILVANFKAEHRNEYKYLAIGNFEA